MLIFFLLISFYLVANNDLSEKFISIWVIINNIFQLLFVCICILTFYYSEEINLNRRIPFFWYILAIMLYASGTVIFYSLWNYLNKNSGPNVLNSIHHVFNIVLYALFTIGFIVNISKIKSGHE